GKPVGRLEVGRPMVKSFLNPLSIRKIPMVGDVTFQLLSRVGIRKIETLAEMPVDVLEKLLGKNGSTLWKKANGIDETPVEPYEERKSISTEQTFEQDTIDIQKVKALLVAMVEKLGFQLRKEGWLVSVVKVKVRYSNFDTQDKQCKILYTSCDHILLKKIHALFDELYQRRMRLRLVGINFSGLVRGNYQIDMFEDTNEMVSLYQAVDKMKNRYGYDAVQRCAGIIIKKDKK
ncbi:MAG: DNA polymerase IV, partial [Bacteroidetes bacterium]|nr:DNA polymerase IV [Bacteroidota bacterium]